GGEPCVVNLKRGRIADYRRDDVVSLERLTCDGAANPTARTEQSNLHVPRTSSLRTRRCGKLCSGRFGSGSGQRLTLQRAAGFGDANVDETLVGATRGVSAAAIGGSAAIEKQTRALSSAARLQVFAALQRRRALTAALGARGANSDRIPDDV